MYLASSFAFLLQELALTMTLPSFRNFTLLVTGWVFASRRTVTGMLLAAGMAEQRHHSAFHRLFSAARWSLDAVGLRVFRILEAALDEESVLVAIDDTLAAKRGLKVFGAGMHYDPQLSSRSKTITRWGHNWVILGVVIRFPLWPSALHAADLVPAVFESEKRGETSPSLSHAARTGCGHAAHPLPIPPAALFSRPGRFGLRGAKRALATARQLRFDQPSAAQGPAARRAASRQGGRGRPRKRGPQLPTPAQMLADRARRIELKIYGRRQRARVCDGLAHLYHVPERMVRVVAVEALHGGRGREAFYSTCCNASAEQVLTWYSWRWSIEQTIRDSKQHLGFEEPQGYTRLAVGARRRSACCCTA